MFYPSVDQCTMDGKAAWRIRALSSNVSNFSRIFPKLQRVIWQLACFAILSSHHRFKRLRRIGLFLNGKVIGQMSSLKRRIFLGGAATSLLFGSLAHAAGPPVTLGDLRIAFELREESARKMVQQSLKGTGYYHGTIDGTWGVQTERAYRRLMASARYKRHAPDWTWGHEARVIDTLFFLTSDAFP